MTTAPITADQLRCDVVNALKPYGLTLDEFLASDVDDLDDDLRDMRLMIEGALSPAS